MKPIVDRTMALVGMLLLIGIGVYLVGNWEQLDKAALALAFVLPIWLTVATLPFVFLFSLFADYETTFTRIDFFCTEAADLVIGHELGPHWCWTERGRGRASMSTGRMTRTVRPEPGSSSTRGAGLRERIGPNPYLPLTGDRHRGASVAAS